MVSGDNTPSFTPTFDRINANYPIWKRANPVRITTLGGYFNTATANEAMSALVMNTKTTNDTIITMFLNKKSRFNNIPIEIKNILVNKILNGIIVPVAWCPYSLRNY